MKKLDAKLTPDCDGSPRLSDRVLKSVRSVAVAVLIATVLCLQAMVPGAQAQTIDVGNVAFTFATVEEGVEILTTPDDFVQRLSPFDRSARLKTNRDVTEAEYLEFLSHNVLEWNDAEKYKIGTALNNIRDTLEAMSLPLPPTVYLVKTTGDEEGAAAYTRSTAIMFPRQYVAEKSIEELQALIAHETFHVLSRANFNTLRNELYQIINFFPGNEITLPPQLEQIKITNPDAPINDHYIYLTITEEPLSNCGGETCEGTQYWAVPILVATSEYDPCKGGEFFDYSLLQFLLVDMVGPDTFEPIYDGDGEPQLVGLERICDFYEQVGKNTDYIIHPEEILAENFVKLVVPTPEILVEMTNILGSV